MSFIRTNGEPKPGRGFRIECSFAFMDADEEERKRKKKLRKQQKKEKKERERVVRVVVLTSLCSFIPLPLFSLYSFWG